jgi:hypothetical protein
MRTIKYQFVDKSDWERGPWDSEPDKIQWQDETTGLACLVRRGPSGAWCGYVGIAPHLRTLIPADGYGGYELHAHGVINYSALCDGDEEHGICHVADPGEADPAFWIGFDCGHAGDIRPKWIPWNREHGFSDLDNTYRDVAYAREQVTRLAAQIHSFLSGRHDA